MTTRTIKRAKVAHAGPTYRATQVSRDAKANMQARYLADGVTRCSKCPPASFCERCNGINRGRIMAGLIRPRHMDVDHKNNILYPVPITKKATKPLRYTRGPRVGKLVSAKVSRRGGGWWQGRALIDGFVIYEGPKTRDYSAALAFATESVTSIREALAMGVSFDV